MMKLFIFLVFALIVFARESLLSSEVLDIISQLTEERSAEATVDGFVTAWLIFFPFSIHLFYLARNSVTGFLSIFNPFILSSA